MSLQVPRDLPDRLERWCTDFEETRVRAAAREHVESYRVGPAWGRVTWLDTVEADADGVPTPICVRIADEFSSGIVWDRLRDALRGESAQ